MDRAHELPAPLVRLKIMIWVHSGLGAMLGAGFLAATFFSEYRGYVAGLILCIIAWCAGLRPLWKKAAEMAPEDRVPPRGLPPWVPLLMGMGSFMTPLWLASPMGIWVAGAWLLLGVTIAIRWIMSNAVGLPVHRMTWGSILIVMALGFWWVIWIGLHILAVGIE
jgi:hypothetical protein